MQTSLKNFTLTGIANIQKAIENNKLIVFVGAGISKNSNIPTWTELVEQLARDMGICNSSKDFSNDELLKIPQYYFIERGEKEYNDRINNIIGKTVFPNKIHEIIFELNPQHIITTNYDNLLEQQEQLQKQKKYSKVACNEELASAQTANFIIKMHGECDNIVLKESDYDSYSNNFKLIETYIKGLFTTNLILFVGFSAEDSNIRKIRQWIKDILGEKYQPAYLLDVSEDIADNEEEFRIKTEYFKSQGIYKLYYSQIESEINILFEKNKNNIDLTNQGLKMYKFLYFIKNYKNDNLSKYYNDLHQLECINVITRDLLSKVFGLDIITRVNSGAFLSETPQKIYDIDTIRAKKVLLKKNDIQENLKYLYNNSLLSDNENKFVSDLIHNSDSTYNTDKKFKKEEIEYYNKIISNIETNYPLLNDEKEKINYIFKIIQKVIDCEIKPYNEKIIYELIDNNINKLKEPNETKTFNIFKKPYILYKQNKLIEAFRILEHISIEYSSSPLLFYLSEFNKKVLSQSIKYDSYLNANEEEKRIGEEYEKIDLELIKKDKIPLSLKNISECFTISYLSESIFALINLCEKIHQTKDLVENGGSSLDYNINNLYHEFYKFWNFTTGNFLFVDNYTKVKDVYFNFVKAILLSYSIDENKNNGGKAFKTNKVCYFDYFDLHIMINYIDPKALKSLLERYKITELKLDQNNKNTKQELINAYINTINSALNGLDYQIDRKIQIFLIIFSLIDLSISDVSIILENYLEFSNKYATNSNYFYNFRNSKVQILNDFIFALNNRNIKIEQKLLEKIIANFKTEFYHNERLNYSLIQNCIYAITNNVSKYSLIDKTIIEYYLQEVKNHEFMCKILTLLYPISNINMQKTIKNIIKRRCSSISLDNIDILYEAVDREILPLTKQKENSILKIARQELIYKKNHPNSPEKCPENINIVLNTMLNFIIIDKWKQKEKLIKFQNNLQTNSDFLFKTKDNQQQLQDILRILKMYLDTNNFDFKNMDPKDIIYLNPQKQKELNKLILDDSKTRECFIRALLKRVFFNKTLPIENKIKKSLIELLK